MKKRILSVGEIIWDVYPEKQVIGGAPLNFAAHAARLGAESSLLSAVGEDALGDAALRALENFGVGTAWIGRNARPTGQCTVSLDANGVPHYDVLRDMAYDHIRLAPQAQADIRASRFDALYFGTLIQRAPESRAALRQIAADCRPETVFCDVNLRPGCYDAESVRFCLEQATVLKVSMEEEPALRALGLYAVTGDTPCGIARALAERFGQLRTVLLTLGKDGAYGYRTENGEDCFQPAVGERVVSTVGAGDSFSAAFLTAHLSGEPLADCMRKAAIVSGFVVAHTEAVPEYPASLYDALRK